MTLFAMKRDDLLAALMSAKAGPNGAAGGAGEAAPGNLPPAGPLRRGTPASGSMQPVCLGTSTCVAYHRTAGGVPVIDVCGPITFTSSWYGTPVQYLCESIRQAADEPGKVMLVDFHCPGGESFGLSDIHAAMKYARSKKTVIGLAHDKAFSLGAIMLQMCDRRYMTPSAMVGAIGVAFALQDTSKAQEMAGYREIVIAEPEGKTDSLSSTISSRSEANYRLLARRYFDMICGMMQPTSGLTPEDVRRLNAQDFAAADAVSAGLVDEVIEYDQLLTRLDSGAPLGSSSNGGAAASPEQTDPISDDGTPKPEADDQAQEAGDDEGHDEGDDAGEDAAGSTRPESRSTHTSTPPNPGVSPESRKGNTMPELKKDGAASAGNQPAPASLEELFDAFKDKEGGLAFIQECRQANIPIGECHKRYAEKLEAKLAEAKTQTAKDAEKNAQLSKLPKGTGVAVADNADKDASGKPAAPYPTFEAAVRGVMADERMDRTEATRAVIKRHPQLHKAMLEAETRETAIEPCERIVVGAGR
jgi:ClpP class serine protease